LRSSWSDFRSYLVEFVAAAILVVGVCVGGPFYDQLGQPTRVFLGGILFVAMAFLLRRVWGRLLGPVLFYDLLRVSRRSQYIRMRCLYAIVLAGLLCWQYSEWAGTSQILR